MSNFKWVGCGTSLAFDLARDWPTGESRAPYEAMAEAPCPTCGGEVKYAVVNQMEFSHYNAVRCVEPTSHRPDGTPPPVPCGLQNLVKSFSSR